MLNKAGTVRINRSPPPSPAPQFLRTYKPTNHKTTETNPTTNHDKLTIIYPIRINQFLLSPAPQFLHTYEPTNYKTTETNPTTDNDELPITCPIRCEKQRWNLSQLPYPTALEWASTTTFLQQEPPLILRCPPSLYSLLSVMMNGSCEHL